MSEPKEKPKKPPTHNELLAQLRAAETEHKKALRRLRDNAITEERELRVAATVKVAANQRLSTPALERNHTMRRDCIRAAAAERDIAVNRAHSEYKKKIAASEKEFIEARDAITAMEHEKNLVIENALSRDKVMLESRLHDAETHLESQYRADVAPILLAIKEIEEAQKKIKSEISLAPPVEVSAEK